ncbi:Hpt domain-containing protein [Thiorhodococcus minor]|uniref:Hpt domain-containing protein n=1 Tax=Thiorhodococcus minor TaxID=57489 RepID=A0A6M0K7F9_9GAMM|nr:Hpt domain-containing protein [Thiorhodococcus minor]NEV64853.1 Hpt domain-containing protein [Thiorhodococcus minor]
MNDHIAKPLDPSRLFETLLRWLPCPVDADDAPSASKPWPQDRADPPASSLEGSLAGIPDLDSGRGLECADQDGAHYLRLSRRLACEHADDMAKIRACLDTGDDAEACRLAHSLKGISSTLGALRIQATVSALEAAIEAGRPRKDVERLIQMTQTAQEELTSALELAPEASPSSR